MAYLAVVIEVKDRGGRGYYNRYKQVVIRGWNGVIVREKRHHVEYICPRKIGVIHTLVSTNTFSQSRDPAVSWSHAYPDAVGGHRHAVAFWPSYGRTSRARDRVSRRGDDAL